MIWTSKEVRGEIGSSKVMSTNQFYAGKRVVERKIEREALDGFELANLTKRDTNGDGFTDIEVGVGEEQPGASAAVHQGDSEAAADEKVEGTSPVRGKGLTGERAGDKGGV